MSWDENNTLPDFYIADFGQACLDLWSMRNVNFAPNRTRDLQSLHRDLSRLLDCPGINAPSTDAVEVQLRQWMERLRQMTRQGNLGAALPNLQGLLDDISAIPAPPIEPDLGAIRHDLVNAGPFVPLLHDTPLAAAATPFVHGPFYVAEVRMNSATGLPDVVSVDRSRTFHRPNANHSGSDTDYAGQSF